MLFLAKSDNIIKLIFIITFLLNIFGAYIYGVFGNTYSNVGNLSLVVLIFLSFLFLCLTLKIKKINSMFFLFLIIYTSLLIIFCFYELIPFIYEYYKLMIFAYFIFIFSIFHKKYFLFFDSFIIKMMLFILFFNFLIIIIQYLISPEIILYFGMSENLLLKSSRMGRWAGFFENPNNLADTALLCLILSLFVNTRVSKYLLIVSTITILISTSKHAILVLILVFLINYRKKLLKLNFKTIFLFFALIVSLYLVYLQNEKSIIDKIIYMEYFINNKNNLLFTAIDNSIDYRTQSFAIGLHYFLDFFPTGTGLGTWGDASSKFISHSIIPEKFIRSMCDSSFSHIIAEQGIFSILYFALLIYSYFIVYKHYRIYFIMLILFYFIVIFFTMGLSSYTWPYLFSYIYARLFYSKNIYLIEKNL